MSYLTRIFTSSFYYLFLGREGRPEGSPASYSRMGIIKKLFLAVRIIIYLSVLTEIP
jgi:hypothetical protein